MLNRHDKKRIKELERKVKPEQKIIIILLEDGVYRISGEDKEVEEAEVERLSKDENNYVLIVKKASE